MALLSAFGRLRVAHQEAFESIGQVLLDRAAWPQAGAPPPDGAHVLKATDLAEVSLAFARARSAHEPVLHAAAHAAAAGGDDGTNGPVPRREAVTILFALCWLRWQHEPLQRRVLAAELAADGDGRQPLLEWSQAAGVWGSSFIARKHASSTSCRRRASSVGPLRPELSNIPSSGLAARPGRCPRLASCRYHLCDESYDNCEHCELARLRYFWLAVV